MKKIEIKPLKAQVVSTLIEIFRKRGSGRLEPEEKLAEQLGVSRSTVREALGELQLQGIVAKRRGKGNFVLKSVIDTEPRIDRSINFGEIIHRMGKVPSIDRTYQGTDLPSRELQNAFGLAPGEKIVRYRWIFAADQVPATIVYIQIPEKLFSEVPTHYYETEGNENIRKNDLLRDYCGQDFSHCVTEILTGTHKESAEIFSDPLDTAYIYWKEFYYNIFDEKIAYSDIYINPEVLRMKMVSSL